jgi:hypothetical protein
MSKTLKLFLFSILGGLIGIAIGLYISILTPKYYSAQVGTFLGFFQGIAIGGIFGSLVVFWKPHLQNFYRSIQATKSKRWMYRSLYFFFFPIPFFSFRHWYIFGFSQRDVGVPGIGYEHYNAHLGIAFMITFLFVALPFILTELIFFVIGLLAFRSEKENWMFDFFRVLKRKIKAFMNG